MQHDRLRRARSGDFGAILCSAPASAADAQTVRRPGRVVDLPFFDVMRPIALPEGSSCPLRRAGARCAEVVRRPVVLHARYAGVVRRPVVPQARYGQPDRVLGVVPIEARYALRDLTCA